ncbi:uncharacterized protein ACBT44_003366 isoform 1-T2 [Syngnathus typhle]
MQLGIRYLLAKDKSSPKPCNLEVSILENIPDISGTLPVHQRLAASTLQQRWQIQVQKVKTLPQFVLHLRARTPGSVLPEKLSAVWGILWLSRKLRTRAKPHTSSTLVFLFTRR